jgi:hypothetical protein
MAPSCTLIQFSLFLCTYKWLLGLINLTFPRAPLCDADLSKPWIPTHPKLSNSMKCHSNSQNCLTYINHLETAEYFSTTRCVNYLYPVLDFLTVFDLSNIAIHALIALWVYIQIIWSVTTFSFLRYEKVHSRVHNSPALEPHLQPCKSRTNPQTVSLSTHFNIILPSMSRDRAVDIATGYGLNDRGVGVRVPVGSRMFSSPRRLDRFCGPPNLQFNRYRGLFPRR